MKLKKISALEIQMICPLHGPVLTEGLEECLRLYNSIGDVLFERS